MRAYVTAALMVLFSFSSAWAEKTDFPADKVEKPEAAAKNAEADAKLAKPPAAEILGIHVGMLQDEVVARLLKMGELVERKAEPAGKELEMKQLWNLRDPRFSSLIVRFDSHDKLKWITAYAREGGPSQLYSDVGDTSLGRLAGRYIYTWKLEAQDSRPASVLTARGTSPERFSSMSLVAAPAPRTAAIPDSLLR